MLSPESNHTRHTRMRVKFLAVIITSLMAAPGLAAQGVESIIDIGALVDTSLTTSNSMTPDGTILLGAFTNNPYAVIWSGPNWTTLTFLSTLKADSSGNSSAQVITSDGAIVAGAAENESGEDRAVTWSGTNWNTITDLGTLKADNSGNSKVRAATPDGAIMAGVAAHDGGNELHATIWSGAGWSTKTDLGTLEFNNSGSSSASAISADGAIVAGQAGAHATVWSGTHWTTKTDLGTLRADNSGDSSASAISTDGTIVVGSAANDSGRERHAAVWSGTGWTTKTDLGTLRADNSGQSTAYGISADGTMVVGQAATDNASHATIWSGTGWATKTDIGTLRADNSGSSSAKAITSDGTIVMGNSIDSNGSNHAALWKLKWAEEEGLPPEVVKAVDATNTLTTINQLAGDTFAAMELQRQGLIRLQDGCTTAAAGDTCAQMRTGFTSEGGNRDTAAGFSIAHGVADNLSIGVSLDRSLSRSLPDSYKKNSNNIGGALYAQWSNPFGNQGWFLGAAVAANQYQVDVERPLLSNTEAGTGSSKMKGFSAMLKAGQNFLNADGRIAGWDAGIRHSNITRGGYIEGNAEFPVTYGDIDYSTTSVFLGGVYVHPVTDSVKIIARAQVEQDLNTNDAEYQASAPYIGGFAQKANMTHTRGVLTAGAAWDVTKDMQLSLMPKVGNSALGDTTWGGDLRLTARF